MARSRIRDVRHLVRSLPGATPFIIARDRVPAMTAKLDELCATEAFDAIHADQLWMAEYAMRGAQDARQGAKPRLILDQHNAVFQIPRRMAEGSRNPAKRGLLALEARKLLHFERAVCEGFDHVAWVTEDDVQALAAQAGYGPTADHDTVIPICVDPERQPLIKPADEPFRVTFLGGLHWPPNAEGMRWFVKEVWPQVAAAHPRAMLTVIGKDPPDFTDGGRRPVVNLDVRGYVDDPTALLAETAVFIVPLHAGGGMRVKILDAWQWGLPIVSTTIGAEGVAVAPGENLLLADTATDFGQAVGDVLADGALAQRLRAGGRRTAETTYNWRIAYRAWDGVYGI
jgi:glycosyltransferase involved in cell wall biosynthesis